MYCSYRGDLTTTACTLASAALSGSMQFRNAGTQIEKSAQEVSEVHHALENIAPVTKTEAPKVNLFLAML